MLMYPSVFFPAFYYGNLYGFCVFGALGMIPFVSIQVPYSLAWFADNAANQTFIENYSFGVIGQGLVTISLLVGTILSEPMAGPFSDWVVRHLAQKNNRVRHPEQTSPGLLAWRNLGSSKLCRIY